MWERCESMSAVLTYKIGELTQRVPCKTVMTIGRDKNSDIVLTDLRVSRNHAMVRRIGHGDYYLVALHSDPNINALIYDKITPNTTVS